MVLLTACSRPLGHLSAMAPSDIPGAPTSLMPHFETMRYHCSVSGQFFFKKFRLSGLLFLKQFPGRQATQVVFQNQMGITYFNFGWEGDSFRVNYVIEQMNRPALIKTLRKDFEMILFKNIDTATARYFQDPSGNRLCRFNFWNAYVYYRLSADGHLLSIDLADEKRKIVHVTLQPAPLLQEPAANIDIDHLTANFTISLKKITPNASGE